MMLAVVFLLVQEFAGISDDFYEAVAVAPLVIVPGDDLEHVAADDCSQVQVYYRRMAVALEITGNKLLFSYIKNSGAQQQR